MPRTRLRSARRVWLTDPPAAGSRSRRGPPRRERPGGQRRKSAAFRLGPGPGPHRGGITFCGDDAIAARPKARAGSDPGRGARFLEISGRSGADPVDGDRLSPRGRPHPSGENRDDALTAMVDGGYESLSCNSENRPFGRLKPYPTGRDRPVIKILLQIKQPERTIRRSRAGLRSGADSVPAEPGRPRQIVVLSRYLDHRTMPSGWISLYGARRCASFPSRRSAALPPRRMS